MKTSRFRRVKENLLSVILGGKVFFIDFIKGIIADMAGIGFESKQTENTPVTHVEWGPFRVRYAYSLSYERVTGNRPSNDYLEWNASDDTLVFALCDGVETSFAGGSAARFLGRRLVEWLSALPAEQAEDLEKVKSLLDAALVEWMPAAQRAVHSKVKASEAVFTCGRISAGPDGLRGFMAGSGLILVRLYDRKARDVSFTPLRHAYDRWSTLRGLRGQIFVEPLGPRPPLQRMMLFTDGLSELEDKLSAYSDAELQTAILESFMSVLNDDISLLDVQICDPPASGTRPRKIVTGAKELSPVHLERVDDALEWETRDDTIYSILEMRDSRGQQVLSAGNFFSWRPPLENACEYRACLVSSEGRAFSPWLAWDPNPSGEDATNDNIALPAAPDTAPVDEPDLASVVEQVSDYVVERTSAPQEPALVEKVAGVEEMQPETHAADVEIEPPVEPVPEELPREVAAVAAAPEPVIPEIFAEPPPLDAAADALSVAPAPEQAVEAVEPAAVVEEPLPVEIQPEPVQPQEAAAAVEQQEPERAVSETSLSARAAGLFARLPDLRSTLRQAQGWLRERVTSKSAAAPAQSGEPWLEKGKYPGQYILHWQASPGSNEYEIWDQPQADGGPGVFHRTSDTRLKLENLAVGLHRFHIRPLGMGFDTDWQAWPSVEVDVPAGVKNPPANVRVESAAEESELQLRWSLLDGVLVDEYWIFEVGREEHRLIAKVAGNTNRFRVRKTAGDRARRFVVRGVNWGGLGPASEMVIYQPGAAPAEPNRAAARRERSSQPVVPEQRIGQVPDLCEAVNRWAKSQNVQMTAMKLEQRYENVDQYILLENRKLNQLVSLPLLKGPEYRLTVYGARGEVMVVEIRFEKRTWVFLVKFLPVLRRG